MEADGIAGEPRGGEREAPVPWFHRVTLYSVLAGLCPLIPIPFLDDRVLAAVKRRMTRSLARERGVALSETQRSYLSGTYGEPAGCLARAGGLAVKLTVKLVAKIFRKVLIFLAAKEAVDVASRTFHEGYLLHLLFDPATPPTWPDPDPRGGELDAWHARWAIERAVEETDPRPVNQAIRRAFAGSRGLLRASARLLSREVGVDDERVRAVEAEEARRLSGLLDPLAAALWRERGYLEALETRFGHWYRTARASAPQGLARPGEAPPSGLDQPRPADDPLVE